MKSKLAKSFVVISLLGLVQCVSMPKAKKTMINPLADRLSALEMDLKDQSKEIARLNSIIQQLRKKNVAHDPNATLGTLMRKVKAEPIVSEKNENPSLPVVKIKPKPEEDSEAISPLMQEVETIVDSSQGSMQTYYSGLQLYKDKHYEDATEAFGAFIKENPNHVYADRAQFMIVDSHFRNKDYGMVIISTNLLESKYPFSLKLPEATYERGIALAEMNQTAQAKVTLSDLIKNYPKDPVADLARKKWAELNKNSAPSQF